MEKKEKKRDHLVANDADHSGAAILCHVALEIALNKRHQIEKK